MILFSVHLIVYSIVLVGLVILNTVVAPERPWFLLIMFGWCGIVICHAHLLMKGGVLRRHRAEDGRDRMDERDFYDRARQAS